MHSEYNERNARALFKLMHKHIEALSVLVEGTYIDGEKRPSTLHKMLENGKFPKTQADALQRAYDTFVDAFQDLNMDMVMPFDMARQDAELALERARQLGCNI
jgi:hypothetical protein